MKSAKGPSIGLFTIGIAALFLIGFLLLVIFGAQTYRNTVGSQNRNNEARATLSYLSAIAKAGDVVMILGKGHEDYQILKDKTIHFDDREVAHEAITEVVTHA